MDNNNANGHTRNENGNGNNSIHPSPLSNHEQSILQLQQQMEQMRKEMEDNRRDEAPVCNKFVNLTILAPPIGTRVDANTFELNHADQDGWPEGIFRKTHGGPQ